MKLHQQFDLNPNVIRPFGRELFAVPPYSIEELALKMSRKGYTVLQSSAYFMGIPQSITLVKNFTGPFATRFSAKMKEDFANAAKNLGMEELFV